jgi:hypothetical protein
VSFPHTLVPFQPPARDLVRAFTVRLDRSADGLLQFHYRLDADIARMRVPAVRERRQVDELWKHTCFEAFVALAGSASEQVSRAPPADAGLPTGAYRELNFAPSTEWAAYAFTGYRAGMTPVAMTAPQIRVESTPRSLELIAPVDIRTLFAANAADAVHPKLKIAIAAVLEDDAGGITYWALQHAPARPDFHHPAGFSLEV